MNLTEDQKRLLTEFLGEEIHPRTEYRCYGKIRGSDETNNCHFVQESRQFDTWQDLGDVKDKLVEKGLWYDFSLFADNQCESLDWRDVYVWLFNPLDEQGNPHFCRLVAEYLEERK
jgi:hypothetical protein